jgi:octanoyl-[GcvH]:protein N-octanoyltransferase
VSGRRRILVAREAVPGGAALDTAVSRELLLEVARGARAETLRLWRPADALAFSVSDRNRPGFARAVELARAASFEPFLRLAGGHAAVYSREILAFAWAMPVPDPRLGIGARFEAVADLVARALRALGVDARVGPVPGEYCPGSHSVNARGRVKLMGVGQRVVGGGGPRGGGRGAPHVGGILVAGGSARLRAVLVPVYEALELPFDPRSVGSVEDERPGTAFEAVAAALTVELSRECELEEVRLDPALVARAARSAPLFEAQPRSERHSA